MWRDFRRPRSNQKRMSNLTPQPVRQRNRARRCKLTLEFNPMERPHGSQGKEAGKDLRGPVVGNVEGHVFGREADFARPAENEQGRERRGAAGSFRDARRGNRSSDRAYRTSVREYGQAG